MELSRGQSSPEVQQQMQQPEPTQQREAQIQQTREQVDQHSQHPKMAQELDKYTPQQQEAIKQSIAEDAANVGRGNTKIDLLGMKDQNTIVGRVNQAFYFETNIPQALDKAQSAQINSQSLPETDKPKPRPGIDEATTYTIKPGDSLAKIGQHLSPDDAKMASAISMATYVDLQDKGQVKQNRSANRMIMQPGDQVSVDMSQFDQSQVNKLANSFDRYQTAEHREDVRRDQVEQARQELAQARAAQARAAQQQAQQQNTTGYSANDLQQGLRQSPAHNQGNYAFNPQNIQHSPAQGLGAQSILAQSQNNSIDKLKATPVVPTPSYDEQVLAQHVEKNVWGKANEWLDTEVYKRSSSAFNSGLNGVSEVLKPEADDGFLTRTLKREAAQSLSTSAGIAKSVGGVVSGATDLGFGLGGMAQDGLIANFGIGNTKDVADASLRNDQRIATARIVAGKAKDLAGEIYNDPGKAASEVATGAKKFATDYAQAVQQNDVVTQTNTISTTADVGSLFLGGGFVTKGGKIFKAATKIDDGLALAGKGGRTLDELGTLGKEARPAHATLNKAPEIEIARPIHATHADDAMTRPVNPHNEASAATAALNHANDARNLNRGGNIASTQTQSSGVIKSSETISTSVRQQQIEMSERIIRDFQQEAALHKTELKVFDAELSKFEQQHGISRKIDRKKIPEDKADFLEARDRFYNVEDKFYHYPESPIPYSKQSPFPGSVAHRLEESLGKHNMSQEDFHRLRLTREVDLTQEQANQLKSIRNDLVPELTKDTVFRKTVPIEDLHYYFEPDFIKSPEGTTVQGYIARKADVEHLHGHSEVNEAARLDYRGTKFTTGVHAYIDFTVNEEKISKLQTPFGIKFGGIKETIGASPFTGNGFTASRNGEVIPEIWTPRIRPETGQIFSVNAQGHKELIGIYNFDDKKFISLK